MFLFKLCFLMSNVWSLSTWLTRYAANCVFRQSHRWCSESTERLSDLDVCFQPIRFRSNDIFFFCLHWVTCFQDWWCLTWKSELSVQSLTFSGAFNHISLKGVRSQSRLCRKRHRVELQLRFCHQTTVSNPEG